VDLDPEQMTRGVWAIMPFAERTGIHVLEAGRGRVRLRMPLEPNVNHIGVMYAGALFTLAEIPGGVLCSTTFDVSQYFPIVKDLRITFLRPATTDVDVEVRMDDAEVERVANAAARDGKCDYGWTCELVDAGGTVVATAECRYQLRSMQRSLS
jgi:uncharacterized protein (TIGR00369 family)